VHRPAQPRRDDPFHRGAEEVMRRELAAVLVAGALLTAIFTYPIAFKPGHVGRVDNGDGQLSIWNVAWVARTLPIDPLHVFDANIFYPNHNTLAYSEANLGAGARRRARRGDGAASDLLRLLRHLRDPDDRLRHRRRRLDTEIVDICAVLDGDRDGRRRVECDGGTGVCAIPGAAARERIPSER